MDDAPSGSSEVPNEGGRAAAATAVLVGGVVALFFGFSAHPLVRDKFHYNCSWDIGGEWGPDGTWVCADGIGYLTIAVMLGAVSGLLVLAGLIVSVALPARSRLMVFLVLAAVSVSWTCWWTLYAATFYAGSRPVGETGEGIWAQAVLPSILLSVLGLLIGAVGALTMRRWSPIVLWCGVVVMSVAAVLQIGTGISAFVSVAMLAAAGLSRGRARPAIAGSRNAGGGND